jgi:hypothetical protein
MGGHPFRGRLLLILLPLGLLRHGAVASAGDRPEAPRIDFRLPDWPELTAEPVAPEHRDGARRQVLQALADYPPVVLGRAVEMFVLVSRLRVEGVIARGYRKGRVVVLELEGPDGSGGVHRLEAGDIHHEIYHALEGYLLTEQAAVDLDPQRLQEVRGGLLAWDAFELSPGRAYSFDWQRPEGDRGLLSRVGAVLGGHGSPAPPGFASQLGTANPREDRATVAEGLMSQGRELWGRARRDPTLRRKLAVITRVYDTVSDGCMKLYRSSTSRAPRARSQLHLPNQVPAPKHPAAHDVAAKPVVEASKPLTALELFDRGDLEEATARWRRELAAHPEQFVVVVALNCDWSSVLEARQSLADSFLAIPVRYLGRECVRVLAGPYGNRSQAGEALKSFPPWVAAEGAVVRRVEVVLAAATAP